MKLPRQKTRVTLLIAAIGLGLTGLMLAPGSTVHAAGTEVVVRLCSLTPQPLNVSVSQPQTDTVVNQSHVTIIGQTDQQAQLDVYLNDVHNNALSTQLDGSFTTSVDLAPGTNTIKIIGASFCGGATNTINLILTYIIPDNSTGSGGSKSHNNDQKSMVSTQIPGISYRSYGSTADGNTGVIINPPGGVIKVNPPSQDKSSGKSPSDYINKLLHPQTDYVKRAYDVLGIFLIIGGATTVLTALGLAGVFVHRRLSLVHEYRWQILLGSLLFGLGLVIIMWLK